MPASRFRTSSAAAAFALALGVLALPGTGFAYTPEQQQACTPDAMSLCGEFVPDVDAITACMIRKKAQLSPQCAAFFRRGPEPEEVRAGQPANIKPVVAKKSKPKARKKKTDDD
ncbi:hypothetical protein ACTGJ9_010950 [Bradyrhizobium sp. RDM12]